MRLSMAGSLLRPRHIERNHNTCAILYAMQVMIILGPLCNTYSFLQIFPSDYSSHSFTVGGSKWPNIGQWSAQRLNRLFKGCPFPAILGWPDSFEALHRSPPWDWLSPLSYLLTLDFACSILTSGIKSNCASYSLISVALVQPSLHLLCFSPALGCHGADFVYSWCDNSRTPSAGRVPSSITHMQSEIVIVIFSIRSPKCNNWKPCTHIWKHWTLFPDMMASHCY